MVSVMKMHGLYNYHINWTTAMCFYKAGMTKSLIWLFFYLPAKAMWHHSLIQWGLIQWFWGFLEKVFLVCLGFFFLCMFLFCFGTQLDLWGICQGHLMKPSPQNNEILHIIYGQKCILKMYVSACVECLYIIWIWICNASWPSQVHSLMDLLSMSSISAIHCFLSREWMDVYWWVRL